MPNNPITGNSNAPLEYRVRDLEERFELLERNFTQRLQSFTNHTHPEITRLKEWAANYSKSEIYEDEVLPGDL